MDSVKVEPDQKLVNCKGGDILPYLKKIFSIIHLFPI